MVLFSYNFPISWYCLKANLVRKSQFSPCKHDPDMFIYENNKVQQLPISKKFGLVANKTKTISSSQRMFVFCNNGLKVVFDVSTFKG